GLQSAAHHCFARTGQPGRGHDEVDVDRADHDHHMRLAHRGGDYSSVGTSDPHRSSRRMVDMSTTLSAIDYKTLHGPMTERLATLGRALSPQQWLAPSLCDGWRVCDVYGHMTYGGVTPMYKVLPILLFKHRGSLNRGSAVESVRYADRYPQEVVLAEFVRSSHHPVGIGKVVKASELHMDHIVHEMDVRRPLGL